MTYLILETDVFEKIILFEETIYFLKVVGHESE